MYVTCQERNSRKQCIAVAYTRGGPLGPYGFISNGPIITRVSTNDRRPSLRDSPIRELRSFILRSHSTLQAETGGCLDPQPFEDPVSRTRFLVFKADTDHMFTKANQLWICKLSEDGLSLDGDMVPIQSPSQDYQGDVLEAPYLTYHSPSNSYCLFYSSGNFSTKGELSETLLSFLVFTQPIFSPKISRSTPGYATSYAISRSGIFGPYHPCPVPLLSTDTPRKIFGPGGACIVKGVEGHSFIIFHALEFEQGPRRMCVHRIEFTNDGVPVLPGRPNTGKRLRLGAEYEDDLEHFGNSEPRHEDQKPFNAPPPPAHPSSSSSNHHQGGNDELKALAAGILGGGIFGHKKEKKHKKKKSHSGSSSSSSSSSDSD